MHSHTPKHNTHHTHVVSPPQFMLSEYADELPELRALSREDCVAWLRRSSSGFARGASRYRGVTRHHQHGKWESRIGRVDGKKYMVRGLSMV